MRLSTGQASPSKNLTGNPRLIRDLAADIHTSIQQWNAAHLQGLSVLKDIIREKVDEGYTDALQNHCYDLETICDSLDTIVSSLDHIAHQMTVMRSLQKKEDKLFLTWPTEKFGEVARTIHEAYKAESLVKRKILENVCRSHEDSWKSLHYAAWLHQPMITEETVTGLESLLLETGHRSLCSS